MIFLSRDKMMNFP